MSGEPLFHAVALAAGYLLGSIPFGLILTRLSGGGDIRSIGSGNIGATNVLRTGRKGIAAATLIGDMLKGTVAVLLMAMLAPPPIAFTTGLAAALGALLGHIFPVWLGFKGGKGVATYLGVLLGVAWLSGAWPAVLAFAALWLIVALVTRYSSLAALVATAATPAVLAMTAGREAAMLFAALSALVWIMHRANIARLLAGTESRIGRKTPPPGTPPAA